jgi:hypothetical protein
MQISMGNARSQIDGLGRPQMDEIHDTGGYHKWIVRIVMQERSDGSEFIAKLPGALQQEEMLIQFWFGPCQDFFKEGMERIMILVLAKLCRVLIKGADLEGGEYRGNLTVIPDTAERVKRSKGEDQLRFMIGVFVATHGIIQSYPAGVFSSKAANGLCQIGMNLDGERF